MYILEIFFKRRKFMKIFDAAWKVIGNNISMSQHAAEPSDPQLELFHFSAVFYCCVYQAALSAGMSSSSAHYLARIQTRKNNIDKAIVAASEEVFAAPDDERLKAYGTTLTCHIEPIVAAVSGSDAAVDDAEFKTSLGELYQYFQQRGFSAAELFGVDS